MSSHHFVKEGQEPALIIADSVPFSVVESLLEWAPFIVVFEQALEAVLCWDIKIDAIVMKASSQKHISEIALHQMPYHTIIAGMETDFLHKAVGLLGSQKQIQANLCVSAGEAYFSLCQQLADQLEISILDVQARWSPVRHGHYKKWLPAGEKLFVAGPGPFKIEGSFHNAGSQTSITGSDEIISVTGSSFFWVGVPL